MPFGIGAYTFDIGHKVSLFWPYSPIGVFVWLLFLHFIFSNNVVNMKTNGARTQ